MEAGVLSFHGLSSSLAGLACVRESRERERERECVCVCVCVCVQRADAPMLGRSIICNQWIFYANCRSSQNAGAIRYRRSRRAQDRPETVAARSLVRRGNLRPADISKRSAKVSMFAIVSEIFGKQSSHRFAHQIPR